MWNEFESEEFSYFGRRGTIVYPKAPKNGKLLLKTEYREAFPDVEIALLNKGYTLCNLVLSNRWGTKEEIDVLANFVEFVCEKFGFEHKCIPVGMSCGGLIATLLAERYPHLVSVMYLDAPVLNILSMCGLGEAEFDAGFWRELVNCYGFSKSTVINFRESPIDHMEVLIENSIPVIMCYGNSDNVVIYGENGQVLEDYYKQNGGDIKVICRSMCGHHPHGLTDPTPIVDFIEEHTK